MLAQGLKETRATQTKAIDEITVSELARAADIDRKTF